MHKHLVLLCMGMISILYAGIDILHRQVVTQPVAVITAAVLFLLFLLLSPAFSQYLFFARWSEEFRQINMVSFAGDMGTKDAEHEGTTSLDDTNLSPREKQVVCCFFKGMTLRQLLRNWDLLFLRFQPIIKQSTKLGINSRAELFILFGRSPGVEQIEKW